MFKKILTLCLAATLILTSFGGISSVNAADTVTFASYSAASGSAVSSNVAATYTNAEFSNDALVVNNTTTSKLIFDLDESMGSSAVDGSSYTVKITYIDAAGDVEEQDVLGDALSFFTIWADKLNYGRQRIMDVPLLLDGATKSVEFEIEDAAFEADDIEITAYDIRGCEKYASAVPFYFQSIEITRNVAKNPVLVESIADDYSNTFKYNELKKITNTFTNTMDEAVNLTAEYYLVDERGNSEFYSKDSFEIDANSFVTKAVNVSCSVAGLYQWIVKIKDDTGKINTRICEDTIAIVKTADDGLKNEAAWIVCHLERYRADNQSDWGAATNEQQACLDLMKNANIQGVRHQTTWYNTEKTHANINNELNIEDTFWWPTAKIYNDNGLKFWVMLSGCAYGYNKALTLDTWTGRRMPVTEDELDGWEDFCKYVMDKYYDTYGVDMFEIWNEPNVEYFNPDTATAENLAEVTKRARSAASSVNSSIKIAGLSVTELNNSATKTNWLVPAVGEGIADSEDGMNVLNVHTYTHNVKPEDAKVYKTVQEYRNYITQNTDVKDIPVLISEYGNPLAEGTDEKERSDWNIRSAILYRMYGIGNQLAIYNLEQKGMLTECGDDHYGIVSPVVKELNIEGKVGIPTEAYLTYAAMNYVLRGEIEPLEMIDCGDNVNINHFKRTTLDDNALALWAAYDDAVLTLDLGVNSVTLYDKFGNESVMTSSDGTYTIPLNTSVSYLTGDFDSVEVVKTEDVFYDGFSDYTCNPWGAPDGWSIKSLSDSEINSGTNLAAEDDDYGKCVRLGSNASSGLYRHPALYKNADYVVSAENDVRFHTDVKIKYGIADILSSLEGNPYHIAVSRASDTEDYIMGFKLVGEADKMLSVHYWNEGNGFVDSGTDIDAGSWVSLDAIYHPAQKPEIQGTYSQTFDSADVISNTTINNADYAEKWTTTDKDKLPIEWVNADGNRSGVLKAVTGSDQHKSIQSPRKENTGFKLPVGTETEYVDVTFDFKSEKNAADTHVYAIIKLFDEKGNPRTGIQLEETDGEAVIYALAADGKYVSKTKTVIDNVLGLWKSYKLRYYPYAGKLEVYMGDTQQTISDVPVFSASVYESQSAAANETLFEWSSDTCGGTINGIAIQSNGVNMNLYLDNVKGASYGYSGADVVKTDSVEYRVNGTYVGTGTSGIGSNNSLETVMLAAFTKASEGKFPALFDNVCIMPVGNSIFFEEKRHSEADGTIEFKTTAVNMSESSEDATIITAFFDEQNRLMDIKMTEKSISGKFEEISGGAQTMSADGIKAKFYIWDMDVLKPISPEYSVKYN